MYVHLNQWPHRYDFMKETNIMNFITETNYAIFKSAEDLGLQGCYAVSAGKYRMLKKYLCN
jgi:hypothetical protein